MDAFSCYKIVLLRFLESKRHVMGKVGIDTIKPIRITTMQTVSDIQNLDHKEGRSMKQ